MDQDPNRVSELSSKTAGRQSADASNGPVVGQEWFVELQGVSVLASSDTHGYQLTLVDPGWSKGFFSFNHPDSIPDLKQALLVARALIESHLHAERRDAVDPNGLCVLQWRPAEERPRPMDL
jgi:hypothetical protein